MIFTVGFLTGATQSINLQELGFPTCDGFARGLGALLLICTALYGYRRTSVVGAILLTAYFGGAIVTRLRAGTPLFTLSRASSLGAGSICATTVFAR